MQADLSFELYKRASASMNDAQSMDMDIRMASTVIVDGEAIDMNVTGNIKQVFNSPTDIDMVLDLMVYVMGEQVPSLSHYTNGFLYMEVEGLKIKMPMSIEEALSQVGGGDMLDFEESAIKSSEITETADGQKITFVLDGVAMSDFMNASMGSLDSLIPGASDMGLHVTLDDMFCEFIVDANEELKSYRMVYEMGINMDGESFNMKADMTMTINAMNDVQVVLPSDLDEYMDMSAFMDF
jgi:hypothetical protein